MVRMYKDFDDTCLCSDSLNTQRTRTCTEDYNTIVKKQMDSQRYVITGVEHRNTGTKTFSHGEVLSAVKHKRRDLLQLNTHTQC